MFTMSVSEGKGDINSRNAGPGGFLLQRSIRGRAAEMGLKISHLV